VAGDIVALYGDLGAGKTVFVKGIAKGLGIKKRIISPTFIFMRTYPIKSGQFIHIDLYRGQNIEDFEALGFEDVFQKNNIVVLEWAQRIKDFLPKKRMDITLEKVEDTERSRSNEKTRRIIISR
jgi:tRNA threonylcarbamoyladenosine biosynthesis protein TsaE